MPLLNPGVEYHINNLKDRIKDRIEHEFTFVGPLPNSMDSLIDSYRNITYLDAEHNVKIESLEIDPSDPNTLIVNLSIRSPALIEKIQAPLGISSVSMKAFS
jgi:hypothetical protein